MSVRTEKKQYDFVEQFVARLENLVEKEDRGRLAILRRGLGKEVPFETYRFMPFKRTRWQENAALLIGPLFANWHQGKHETKSAGEKENIGSSLLLLVDAMVRENTDRDIAMKRVERRFSALLNCHSDDLKPHLRHIVSLLKTREIPINWRLLCLHVQWWDHEDRWVQREWARSFWGTMESNGDLEEDIGVSEETGADDSSSE